MELEEPARGGSEHDERTRHLQTRRTKRKQRGCDHDRDEAERVRAEGRTEVAVQPVLDARRHPAKRTWHSGQRAQGTRDAVRAGQEREQRTEGEHDTAGEPQVARVRDLDCGAWPQSRIAFTRASSSRKGSSPSCDTSAPTTFGRSF